MKHPLWVVMGTGTEIGKTTVSCALLECCRRRNAQMLGLKPVETGVSPTQLGADALALSQACRLPHPQTPFTFADPVSPHLAATRENRPLGVDQVAAWVRAHATQPALVETAGGAFSPLSLSETNATLAETLAPTALIVVCPDRLGAIHDTTATLFALRAQHPGLPRPVIILNDLNDHRSDKWDNARALRAIHQLALFPFPNRAHDAGHMLNELVDYLSAPGHSQH